jgi:hypothetical protein
VPVQGRVSDVQEKRFSYSIISDDLQDVKEVNKMKIRMKINTERDRLEKF